MKKLVSLLLVAAMAIGLLPVMAMATDIDTSEHVVITYLVTGDVPTNKTDEVLAKVNEILTEKVNAELAIEWIEWTDWQTKYNLALAMQDGSIDLIGTATDWLDAWPNAQKGAFLPLGEEMLKTYAPKTYETVSADHWDLCKYNGQIYLMPEDNYAQWANHGYMYRGDWAKAAGLDGVHSWTDLGKYFAYIKENMPGVIPWDASGSGGSLALQMAGGWLTSTTPGIFVEGLPVALFFGESKDNPYTMSRFFLEGDELVNFANTMKQWADAGYWRSDVLNYTGDTRATMEDGMTGADQHHTQTWKGQRPRMEEKQPGADLSFFWFGEEMNNLVKLNITHGAMAVAAQSKHPERALMVYDLMRNDPEIYNLINYGLEGSMYTLDENGYRKTPDGFEASVEGSSFNFWWGRNDDLEIRDAKTDWAAYDALMAKYDACAIDYPYGKVVFDLSGISSKLDNLSNVYNTYMAQIGFGMPADPAAYVAEFREALKAAGYEECIAEIEKQIGVDKITGGPPEGFEAAEAEAMAEAETAADA